MSDNDKLEVTFNSGSRVLIDWTEYDRDDEKKARIHTPHAVYPKDVTILEKTRTTIVLATTWLSRSVYIIPTNERISQTCGWGYHVTSYEERPS